MRPIDADELIRHFSVKDYGSYGRVISGSVGYDDIAAQPTIDAVPVVRCGECRSHKPGHYRFSICRQTEDDFYCARGEREDRSDRTGKDN